MEKRHHRKVHCQHLSEDPGHFSSIPLTPHWPLRSPEPVTHGEWVCFGSRKPTPYCRSWEEHLEGLGTTPGASGGGDRKPQQLEPRPPFPGSAASPQPSPSAGDPRGSTHQLGQEEGIGDGDEQQEPQGHLGRGVAGGGRQVRGGHLSPAAWCPWLRTAGPRCPSNITSCPTHPSDVAWEEKKKFQPSRSFHWLQPTDSSAKRKCGFGFASDGPWLPGQRH